MILACTVLIQLMSVTDGQTDRQTDGRTPRRWQRRAKHSVFARKNVDSWLIFSEDTDNHKVGRFFGTQCTSSLHVVYACDVYSGVR